ncbi:ABC transporter G family member 23 [Orchesella cincta]|uniref:ABC transporter G family member 23 n=1 Tax=Orchesella cincta TaxID=48709 RepID=A0A1D2MZ79_ORCCI|nr:ABC transporter G family member 23 [Orchesella cincta]
MGTAVQVENAWKHYKVNGKREAVLQGLHMTVPCGALYCLVGSSGCGKTSLLSCIVGIRKLDKGSSLVFGEQPGTNNVGIPGKNVGFMPQDITLYGEFSILETFRYFGTLNGMVKKQVDEKSNFLQELLELPHEPTVGVDALVCHKIWTYLRSLSSSEGTTIIISTHYLNEARKADLIGIIRGGIMIAETSPTQLINSDVTGSLQNAVLALCKKGTLLGNSGGNIDAQAVNRANKTRVTPRKSTVPKKQLIKESTARVAAIVRKNATVLFRNLLLLSFVIWIPALEILVVCIAYGYDPTSISVGVVNQELNASRCPEIIPVQGECDVDLLSCSFLSHIPFEKLELIPFELEQDAKSAIHSGLVWGYVLFSPNFSSSMYERVITGVDADQSVLNSSTIIVKLDDTNKPISASINVALHDALEDFTSTLLSNCGFDSRQGHSPLQYGVPVFGNDDTDLREYSAPSMAVAVMFFWPIVFVGTRFMEERISGMLERSVVAGVRNWEIFLAYLITEFFILLPQTVFALAVTLLVPAIKIVGSIYLAFGLLLLISCCAAITRIPVWFAVSR